MNENLLAFLHKLSRPTLSHVVATLSIIFKQSTTEEKDERKKNGEICEYLETRAEARTYMYAPAGIKRSSRTDHGNLTRIVFATHCTVCIDNLKRLQKWSAV